MNSEKVKIMVVDDNHTVCDILTDYFNSLDDMEVACVANDGLDAFEKIINNNFDVVLLDIIMPTMDGIGVLEKLSTVNLVKRPKIIMVSAIGQDRITQRALSLGADFYVIKPVDLESLTSRIRYLVSNSRVSTQTISHDTAKSSSSLSYRDQSALVSKCLMKAGIPVHTLGYKYLHDAVLIVLKQNETIYSITKTIYPRIAEQYHTNVACVDRAMRHAIELAINKDGDNSFEEFMGIPLKNRKKPSNSKFIGMIAEKIKLENMT